MNDDGGLFHGIDTVAEEAAASGEFVTRRELVRIKRARGSDDTLTAFSVRVRVKAANTFIAFCNKRRLTYREGFDLVAAYLEHLPD